MILRLYHIGRKKATENMGKRKIFQKTY